MQTRGDEYTSPNPVNGANMHSSLLIRQCRSQLHHSYMLTQNDQTECLLKIFIQNIDEKQEYNDTEVYLH